MKKKQNHMTKNELLYHLRGMSRMNLYGEGVAYRDASILLNYILWKSEKFKTEQFIKFNDLVNKKFQENSSIEEINKQLKRKANFVVDNYECTIQDIPKIGNKVVDKMRANMLETDNKVQKMTEQYLVYSYGSLMEMGFGKTRLTRVKENITDQISIVDADVFEIYKLELYNEVGLVIELPEGF